MSKIGLLLFTTPHFTIKFGSLQAKNENQEVRKRFGMPRFNRLSFAGQGTLGL
jgi:hypothetical protein